MRDWLHGHADRPLARLALLWLRRYLEASRNSGAAASIYFTLSALPTALVVIAFFNLAAKNENAFSNRLIAHMKLDGATANLVRELFGSTSNNVLAATVTIVFGFLLWGLGIGQVYRDLYARAWRIQVGSVVDQVRFAIWFFVTSGLVGLMTVSAANLRSDGWLVLIPAWIAASMHLLALDAALPAPPGGHAPRPRFRVRCSPRSSSAARSPPRRFGSAPP